MRRENTVLRAILTFALTYLMLWGGFPVPALAEIADEAVAAAGDGGVTLDTGSEEEGRLTADDGGIDVSTDEVAYADVDPVDAEPAVDDVPLEVVEPEGEPEPLGVAVESDQLAQEELLVVQDGPRGAEDESDIVVEPQSETSGQTLSGSCGPNLRWTFSNGTLAISGTGEMTTTPWISDYRYVAESITSLVIGEGVTSIAERAFRECNALRGATRLPMTLKTIGEEAFYGCTALQSAVLPDGLERIDGWAFANCTSLATVSIPQTVVAICECAFEGSESLDTVYYAGTEGDWNRISIGEYNEPLRNARKYFQAGRLLDVSYGVPKYDPTDPERIRQLANEYEARAQAYIAALGKEADAEARRVEKSMGGQRSHDQMLKDVNGSSLTKVFTPNPSMPDKCRNVAYKALAEYFDTYISIAENLTFDKLDLSKENATTNAKMVNKVRKSMSNFDNWSKTVDGHKVCVKALASIAVSYSSAYVLHLTVDGKYDSIVCSTPEDTSKVLNAYINELRKLAEDAKYSVLCAMASDCVRLSGIGEWTKSRINDLIKSKVSKIQDEGLRASCEYLLRMRKGYDVTCQITSTTAISDLQDALKKPQSLADKLAGIDLSEVSGCPATVYAAMKAAKRAKEELVRALYDYATNAPVEKSLWDRAVDALREGWGSTFKSLTFQCPVDVYVYDGVGNELGHIVGGEVSCGDSVAMRLDGDVKTVIVPSSVDASVRLVGTGSGTMTCVEEQVVDGKVTGRANWYGVPLAAGCEFTQTVSAVAMTGANADEIASSSGIVRPSEYIPASDASANVSVTVVAGEGGTAVGSDAYARGTSVAVYAYPDKKHAFEGWYAGETLISTEASYRFPARDDVTLTARFSFEEGVDDSYLPVVSMQYENDFGLGVWRESVATDSIMLGISGYEGELPSSLTIRKLDGSGQTISESSYAPENQYGAWLVVRGQDLSDASKTEVLAPDGSLIGTIYPEEAETVASGTCGTCDWTLDVYGTLTIYAGTLPENYHYNPDYYNSYYYWPWLTYDKEIRSVRSYGRVVSGTHLYSAFINCPSLTTADLSNWDTSSTKYMDYMFMGCSSLSSLDLSGWDTSSVTRMDHMFMNCNSLSSLDLSGWDTSSATDMYCMFSGCSSLKSLDVSHWDTSSVKDTGSMFYGCSSLMSLDLSGWKTSNVESMSSMFLDCSSLASLDPSGWDTSKVAYMERMFSGCSSLASLDLTGWDTSEVTTMEYMFYSCSSLSSLNVSGWDTSKVTRMGSMFLDCSSLSSLDLSGWDTSNVTNMDGMFNGCPSLASLDIAGWDTSKVVLKYYIAMYDCPSLSSITVGEGYKMYSMSMFPNGIWWSLKDQRWYTYIDIFRNREGIADTYVRKGTKNPQELVLSQTYYSLSYGCEPFDLGAELRVGNGMLSYASSNTSVAKVNGAGKVTIVGVGKAVITVEAAATDVYDATSQTALVYVYKGASWISLASQTKTYTGKALGYSGKMTRFGSGEKITYHYYSDYACRKELKPAKVKDAGTYFVRATVDANGKYESAMSGPATFKIAKAPSTIKLAAQTKTYTGKALAYSGKVTRKGSSGKVRYKYYSDKTCKKAVKAADVKAAGTYYVRATVAADANHKAATSAAAKLTVKKAANAMKVKAVSRTAKLVTVKKKAVTVATPVSFTKKAQGKVTYARVAKGSSAALTVNKATGKVTVRKGTKKGTYTIKVKVTAAGNANYGKLTKTVSCKVVVK